MTEIADRFGPAPDESPFSIPSVRIRLIGKASMKKAATSLTLAGKRRLRKSGSRARTCASETPGLSLTIT